MKRTLIISMEFPPQVGGIATYVHALASALPAESTWVLAPKDAAAAEWDAQQSYHIVRADFLYPAFMWPRWLKLWWVVKRLVREQKIERIMVHHVLPVGYVAQLAKRALKVPFVVFSHGTDIVAATTTDWKKRRLRQVLNHTDHVIYNSQSLRERGLKALPEFAAKSTVLYPCPDENFFTPPPAEVLVNLRAKLALEGKRVLLSIGRLVEGKGFPHLIPILQKVLQDNPNVVWVIVGSGAKSGEVIQQIQAHSLQNVVRFVGEVPHNELRAYYHLADIFILLTHPDNGQEEGLGLVFLEAAAAGLPVIAGKSGGVEEGVHHNETGYIFDVYSEKPQISAAIVSLLEQPAAARQLGAQGQARMRAEFNWPQQLAVITPWLE